MGDYNSLYATESASNTNSIGSYNILDESLRFVKIGCLNCWPIGHKDIYNRGNMKFSSKFGPMYIFRIISNIYSI